MLLSLGNTCFPATRVIFRITAAPSGKQRAMLAIVAAILFGIAFVVNATGTATDAAFSVTGLLLLGLVFLALHQAGIGSAWVRRR
jgi:hypothetical protein